MKGIFSAFGFITDIILLGPQVRFAQNKIKQQCPGIPVEPIDMKLYGRMDGKGVLEFAKAHMGDW